MAKVRSQGGEAEQGGWSLGPLPDLPRQLGAIVRQIPPGRVATYGDVAVALGSKAASRWVATELAAHEHTAACGCHRVVRLTGELGGYRPAASASGACVREKADRLAAEGIQLAGAADAPRVDLPRYRLAELAGERPLARLEELQRAILERIDLEPLGRPPALVAGVDVSYPRPARGVAAYAVIEAATGELVWSKTIARPVRFPYITSFLSYREVPILLELLSEVRAAGKLAEVILVDGAGILHPRGAGHAAHLGVVTGLPTIGITKKHLFGRVDIHQMQPSEPREVLESGEPDARKLGAALLPATGTARPIFVSPGHRVSVAEAISITQAMLLGRRLPEPIYWADRLSRQAGK